MPVAAAVAEGGREKERAVVVGTARADGWERSVFYKSQTDQLKSYIIRERAAPPCRAG